jgi:hypothetical protein
MKFFMTAVISALFLADTIQVRSQQASNQSNISAEEYAIYATVIGKMPTGSQSKAKLLVINGQTVSNTFAHVAGPDEEKRVKQEFSSLISQETIDDYVAKNAKSHQLTKSFDFKLKYTLISKGKFTQIFKNAGDAWSEFHRQFPDSDGFISLSRAGLAPTGNQALVYISYACRGLCGAGYYMLLVKNEQRWIVQKAFMAWIS